MRQSKQIDWIAVNQGGGTTHVVSMTLSSDY